jgi:hypothetical protein
MEPDEVFRKFKEQDYAVVRLDDLLRKVELLRPVDIAQAIIDASEQGARPVNFRLRSSDEYWRSWTHFGNGAVLDVALKHLGYLVTFQTNSTSDGRHYSLRRKE